MRQKLIALAGKIVFRIAFAGLILVQFVVVVLLLWGLSRIFSEDNYFVVGVVVVLVLLSPFLIGANSYFLFQRFTRVQYVLAESERWLAERRHTNRPWIRRRKILKRWAVWIPTASVVLLCVFMDYTWAFTSHLFHPGSGRLTGYEVSIPFTWSIPYSDTRKPDGTFSIVVAERCRGLIKAGSGLYVGRAPAFTVSSMNFRSIPAGDEVATDSATNVISIRRLPIGKETVECREEVPPQWTHSENYIHCSTATVDFSANFIGAAEDVDQFYRVLGSIKRRN